MNTLLADDEEKRYASILSVKQDKVEQTPTSQLSVEEQSYASIINQNVESEREVLRQSLMMSVNKNPDQVAQIEKLSQQSGLPQPTVERNLAVVVAETRARELSEAARYSPILARQLADPKFASVAYDDSTALSGIEAILTKGRDYAGSLPKGALKVLGGTISGFGELYGVGIRQLEAGLDKILPNSAMSFLRTPVPWYVAPEQILKRTGKPLKDFGDMLGAPQQRQGLDTDVIEGIGQLGFQIASWIMTGGATATSMMLGQGADVMADKTRKDDASQSAKDAAIIAGAGITAMTERIGLDKILNRVPPEIRNRTLRFIADKGIAFGIEFAQETAEGLLHDLTRRVFTKEDAPILEGALREGTAAGLAAAIVRTALGVRGFRGAKEQEEFFRALGDSSADSKLRQRLPEKFQDLVAKISENGPVQNVYIPANEFQRYYQEQGVDPAVKAAQFNAKNYTEAVAAGSDIVIPIDDFTTFLAPTDDLQGLFNDLRLEQGGMTAREFSEYQADEKARLDEIIQRAKEVAGEVQTPDLQAIKQEMLNQLIGTGYEQTTADAYATVYAKTISNLSERAGLSPRALHDKYNLSVNRPLPDVLTRDTRSDINIDPLLDRLRTGDVPTEAQIYGKSLTDFLLEKGGLRPVGELTDIDAGRGKFQKKLLNETGMSADAAAQMAVEAGYLMGKNADNVTESDLFDALNEEAGGARQFSVNEINDQLMNLSKQIEGLDDYLRQLGIDLKQITDNAQVRKLIQQASQTPEGQELMDRLFQAAVGVETAQDQTNSLNDMRVSPRLPTSAKSTENIFDANRLQPSLEAMMQDPKQFAKNIGLMAMYPNFKGLTGTPAEQAEQMIVEMVDNLMYLYNGWKPEYQSRSKMWYVGGNRIATRWATRFGLMPQQVAGVMAALSPQKDWFQNVSLAERILDAVINNSDTAWSAEMTNVINTRDWGKKLSKELGYTPSEQLQKFQGKTLKQMYDPNNPSASLLDMAVWIRAWDEANNVQAARVITPEGGFLNDFDVSKSGVPVALRAQSFGAMTKALKILQATTPQEISEVIGANHKVRSFYNNIIAPFSGDDVTIDTHAVAAALLRPLGSSDIEVGHNFGSYAANSAITGSFGTYGIYAEAYRRAAAQVGILPREMQSITWEAIRGMFRPEQKTVKTKSTVDNLWNNVSDKQLDANDAREQISQLVGGIAEPAWVGSAAGSNETATDSSYKGEVSGAGVSGRSAAAVGVRAGGEPTGAVPTRLAQSALDKLSEEDLDDLLQDDGVPVANNLEREQMWGQGFAMFAFPEQDEAPVLVTNKEMLDSYAPDRLLALSPEAVQKLSQDERGFIEFGKDRKFNITLLQNADLSTFLHETGHFYLEVLGDLAEMADANQQIKDDYATVLKFLGVNSRAELTLDGKKPGSAEYKKAVAAHEKFARANELYLAEGKAPSAELRPIFQRFRQWLKLIYKEFTRLDVEINNQVRQVFDRIYATDEEIDAAKGEMSFDGLLLDAASAGMTDAEFALYKTAVAQATESGKEALQSKLMKELQRERETFWKEESAKVREEVAAEVDATQVFIAFKELTEGDIKLNKNELVEQYGVEYVRNLPRGFKRVYTTGEGMPLDAAASFLGYPSGDALIEALAGMPNRNEYIKGETDRRMKERYGDIMTDGSIADEAKIALHNSQREKVLATELRALRRKQREVAPFLAAERARAREGARAVMDMPPTSAFRLAAQGMIGQTAIRDLEPQRFLNAGRKQGKIAVKAMVDGDYATAADAKQRELLNHFLYLEARKARDRADKIAEYMRKFETKTTRERIGKAGGTYLEQIDAILDGYEFRRIPNRQIDRRAMLNAFVAKMEASAQNDSEFSGEPVNIPQSVLDDGRQINYRLLSVDELEAVNEAVRNIANLAGLKNKLLRIQEKRSLDEIVGDAQEHIIANSKGGKAKKLESALPGESLKRWAKGFMLIHTKMATQFRQMDGWKDNGMLWNLFVRPLNERADYEAVERAKATKELRTIFGEFRDTSMMSKQFIPSLGQSMTLQGRLMVALNWGRAENRQRLMDGNGLSQQNIDEIFGTLNERDWKFVQNIWDYIDSYWPNIQEQYERLYGVAPEKSAALPFETKYGTMNGGYFPIKYDPTKSAQSNAQNADEILQQMKSGAFVRSQTKNGFTKEVLEKLDRPIKLDFSSIYEHLNEVIHDLALREYLLDTNKLFNHRVNGTTLKQTILDQYGDQYFREITDAIRDISIGDIGARGSFEKSMAHLRAGVSIVGMGWNLMTGLMQPLGLTQSMVRVGPKWIAKGLMKFGTDAVSLNNSAKVIYEKSAFMATRMMTQNREINEIRNQIKRSGKYPIAKEAWGVVEDSYFQLIIQGQKLVDIPTWLGAEMKALENGADAATAIALADQAVIDAQGGGSIKDLAAIQRGSPLLKVWTNFYSYFNTTLNLTQESFGKTNFKDPISIGRLAGDLLMLYTAPAILGVALREAVSLLVGGEEKEEEELIEKLIKEQATYILGTMVGLREFASAFDPRFGYSGPAGARFIAEFIRFSKEVSQGELDEGLRKSAISAGGMLLHFPAGQLNRIIDGITALQEGKTSSPAAIIFGPPKD